MFTDRLLDGFYKEIWTDTPHDSKQLEMEFLWPHRGIQLDLELDTEDCDIRTKHITITSHNLWGKVTTVPNTTIVAPILSVAPTNSVGQLNIGSVQIGLEKKPNWYQKLLYKLLGFNWNEK